MSKVKSTDLNPYIEQLYDLGTFPKKTWEKKFVKEGEDIINDISDISAIDISEKSSVYYKDQLKKEIKYFIIPPLTRHYAYADYAAQDPIKTKNIIKILKKIAHLESDSDLKGKWKTLYQKYKVIKNGEFLIVRLLAYEKFTPEEKEEMTACTIIQGHQERSFFVLTMDYYYEARNIIFLKKQEENKKRGTLYTESIDARRSTWAIKRLKLNMEKSFDNKGRKEKIIECCELIYPILKKELERLEEEEEIPQENRYE